MDFLKFQQFYAFDQIIYENLLLTYVTWLSETSLNLISW